MTVNKYLLPFLLTNCFTFMALISTLSAIHQISSDCNSFYHIISYQIAGTGKMTAKDLSRDHKPDDADEMARIKQWGGFVSPAPDPGLSARVYLDAEFTMIGLAMSRSIGRLSSPLFSCLLYCAGYTATLLLPYIRTHYPAIEFSVV